MLEDAAQKAAPSDRDALLQWVIDHGHPAKQQRNKVLHAIAYTAEDGKQALQRLDTGERLLRDDLLEVAGELGVASRELPPGPYSR